MTGKEVAKRLRAAASLIALREQVSLSVVLVFLGMVAGKRLKVDQGPRCPAPGLRDQVVERDGLVCGICAGPVAPDDVHIDHVEPWAMGGETTLNNLRVTHSRCNLARGARH